MLPSSRREESCVTSTCIRGPWLSPFQQYPPLLTTSICPSISLILLSCIPSCFIFLHPWSSTWSRIRAWVPPLREETLPSVANITPNSPPLPPFKAQVLSAWMAINVASIHDYTEPSPPPILPTLSLLHPLFRPSTLGW